MTTTCIKLLQKQVLGLICKTWCTCPEQSVIQWTVIQWQTWYFWENLEPKWPRTKTSPPNSDCCLAAARSPVHCSLSDYVLHKIENFTSSKICFAILSTTIDANNSLLFYRAWFQTWMDYLKAWFYQDKFLPVQQKFFLFCFFHNWCYNNWNMIMNSVIIKMIFRNDIK